MVIPCVVGVTLAEQIDCHVVSIQDGDTLTCLTSLQEQIKVRVGDIDAPELSQPFGPLSKQSLSGMCIGKDAVILVLDRDRYGRIVGRVNCAGIDANLEQVRAGMAWAYRQYLRDHSLIEIEAEARRSLRGLWADPDPAPPWDYRRSKSR